MNDKYHIYSHECCLVIEVLLEKFDFFEISDSSIFLRGIIKDHHYPDLIFDFMKVKIIDSSVFGLLIEIQNTIKKNGNEIVILCKDEYVLHIMNMLSVPRIIQIFDEMDKAMNYLRNEKST